MAGQAAVDHLYNRRSSSFAYTRQNLDIADAESVGAVFESASSFRRQLSTARRTDDGCEN